MIDVNSETLDVPASQGREVVHPKGGIGEGRNQLLGETHLQHDLPLVLNLRLLLFFFLLFLWLLLLLTLLLLFGFLLFLLFFLFLYFLLGFGGVYGRVAKGVDFEL